MIATTLLIAMLVAASLTTLTAASRAQAGWSADPEIVAKANDPPRPNSNYEEDKVPDYELPEVLATRDGQPIETPEQWRSHREELLDLFRKEMFGRRPGAPDQLTFDLRRRDENALDGRATYHRIDAVSRVGERSHRFEFALLTPNEADGPVPAMVLIDHRSGADRDRTQPDAAGYWSPQLVIERGYAAAVVRAADLAPDNNERYKQGLIELFEGDVSDRPADAVMALAAWGWGASRVMDYFEQNEAVDASRVAVLGHSRSGKAALWTGAEDERFDVVISNNSGCGGAALSRRAYGETVGIINNLFPRWFTENFKAYNDREDELPFDQHQLLALIAPRAAYVASADEDLWADPRGEYLGLAHGSRVWSLWDHEPLDPDAMPALEEPVTTPVLGYHIRRGGHGLTPYDWQRYLEFVSRRWDR